MPDSPVESIFFAALGKPTPDARDSFLAAACGGDADLRRRVERLLAVHPPAEFLEQPAADAGPTRDGPAPTSDHVPAADVGSRVGPYKLLQRLGEGGMGEVWVAEQSEPVKRRVALKLIKPGMDTDRVIARFEAERQALALMDHTNIAKVFDAGTTPAGRPYFAMELVKGVPITTYCDELHLSVRDRLGLFIPVCQAVQHAHQKGVIHRDIKPTNVLVAIQDGKPVPKVIDFGVAKALTARLAERTMYTELGAVIGTLEYMAPEQAELSALDVDTRADVYALGALLYELLTGTTPLARERLKTAGLAEVLRLIREEEPPKPSTRLTQSKEGLAGLAAKRRTEPRKLGAEVRGDLDWIVMKCLEKDRTRRYDAAGGLAKDVERYLRDDPVEACPPGAGYRFRKFLRRNRVAATATAAVLVAILLSVFGQTMNLLRAHRAEQLARTAAAEAVAQRQAAEDSRQAAVDERQAAVRERDRATRAEAEQANERKKAETERDAKQTALVRSDGLRLGSEAMIARQTDPGLALLLGLEAVRRHSHPLTFNALFDAAADLRERRAIATDLHDLHHFRVSPDGARFLVGEREGSSLNRGSAAVHDAATGKKLIEWHGFHNGLADVGWSPDATRAVAATGGRVSVTFTDGQKPDRATYTERVAYVWDATTGRDLLHLRGHPDKVVSARFSPDGRKIVTASWDETARLWDAADGRELHVLRGHARALLTAIFSPDGRRVLTVSSQEKKTAHYRDDTGKPVPDRYPNMDPGIPTRPWRSEGSSIGYRGGFADDPERAFARLWDADTGRQVGELVVEKGAFGVLDFTQDKPMTAAFSPDGKRIVVGFQNDMIGVWDAVGGSPVHLFRRHGQWVDALAFSPDGRRLATAGHKNFIALWDLETGRELRRLEGHDHTAVYSVQFSKDGSRLVSAAADKTARVWDVHSGKELAAFRGHTGPVRAAYFHGDRDTVVTAGDGTVRFWSVPVPAPVPTLLAGRRNERLYFGGLFGTSRSGGHTANLRALAFTADGKTVLTGATDHTAWQWDAETGRPKGTTSDLLRGNVIQILPAPDGTTVYLGTELNRFIHPFHGDKDTFLSMVHRWDLTTGKVTRFLKNQSTGVRSMTISPDGRRLLVTSSSSGLVYRPTKANPQAHMWAGEDLAGRTAVWDVSTGQLLARLPDDKQSYNTPAPLFSPDGTVLYPRGGEAELAIYDAQTGKRVRALAPTTGNPPTDWAELQISPDGRTVAGVAAYGQDVWFWDAAGGRLLGAVRIAANASVWKPKVRFSPDSKRLAVCADRIAQVIDVVARTEVAVLRGHEAEVKAVAFSPDGSRLLTGSDDRSAILWDAATGGILAVYKGHPGSVHLVAYSPDGKRVATASVEPVARVWPVNLLPEFEKRKPRELTLQERQRYELPAK